MATPTPATPTPAATTTPPATPPTPPAAPAATRTRRSGSSIIPLATPRSGGMTFQLQRLAQPLELEQVCRDPAWDKFKTFMVVIGGIAVLAWLVYGSFQAGANTMPKPSPITVHHPVVAPAGPPPAVSTPAPSGEPNAEERERHFKEYLRSQDR